MKPMTRRSVLTAAVALAAAARVDLRGVLAQSATPGAAAVPADLSGYPVLAASITDKGYDLSTTTVPSGLVLLAVTNNSSAPTGAAVLGPGKGQTMDDFRPPPPRRPPTTIFRRFCIRPRFWAVRANCRLVRPVCLAQHPGGRLGGLWRRSATADQFKSVEGGGNATEPKADVDVLLADFTLTVSTS